MRGRIEDIQVQKQSPRVQQETMFSDQIQASLQKPLAERCEDVRRMIDGFSIKDLHLLYPRLLGSIFGFNNFSNSWSLHSTNSRNIEGLRHFLGPRGPIWRLVEKLERDSFLKYEFPVACLPKPTQLLLLEGDIPALYCNKVQYQTALVLNLGAMEYFLFQFAYFITQPNSQLEGRFSERSNDTLYTALFSDYLEHFLPTNTPLTRSERLPGVYHKAEAKRYFNTPGGEPRLRSSTLFSGLIKTFENKPSSSPCSPSFDQPSSLAIQSEAFLQILLEVWLNHTVDKEGTNTFSPFGQDYFLPNIDHVRVVRMLIKHLHLFMNVTIDSMAAVTFNGINEDLYRTFMPETLKILKKRLYWFIHHCFAHWPLDSTFRFILETWLSYIQPWRYLNPESPSHNSRGILSLNWKPFIDHNLLYYTVLLQEFLNRAEKLNLRSLKDTQMFYRVTKVFSQQYLMTMIYEGEHELISCLSSVQQSFSQRSSRSPKSAQYSHLTELQIPGTIYKPLFMEETINNINYLVHHLEDVLQSLKDPQKSELQTALNGGWFERTIKGTFKWLQDVFNVDEHYWLIQDENRKVLEHLDQVCKQLKKMFQIQDDEHERTFPWAAGEGDTSISNVGQTPWAGCTESQPDCVQTEQGVVLTALGKYQMANGLRRFDIQYSGDPDLQPVRSYELVFLVRALYKLSALLNEKLGPKLSRIYCSPGWPAYLIRRMSPAVEHPRNLSPVKQDHSKATPRLTAQPKISLRYLASCRLWTQLLLLSLVMLFVLDRPWSTVLLIMSILSLMFLRNIHAVQKRDNRQSGTGERHEG